MLELPLARNRALTASAPIQLDLIFLKAEETTCTFKLCLNHAFRDAVVLDIEETMSRQAL
jgi:hypothetical protein